jgi:hypothetical protein
MSRINLDLDDLTPTALKRLVKQLLTADDAEEKKLVSKIGKHSANEEQMEADDKERNDLADLHEEKHGKPNTPKVEQDSSRAGFPPVPKKGKV